MEKSNQGDVFVPEIFRVCKEKRKSANESCSEIAQEEEQNQESIEEKNDSKIVYPPRRYETYEYFGRKFIDYFRPLENLEDEQTKKWIEDQVGKCRSYLDKNENHHGFYQDLHEALKEPPAEKKLDAASLDIGGVMYPSSENKFFWKNENFYFDSESGSVRLIYKNKDNGDEKVVLDEETVRMNGNSAKIESVHPSPDERYLYYVVSQNKEQYGRLRDLSCEKDDVVAGILNVSFVAWHPSSKGFYYMNRSDDLYYHALGFPWAENKLVMRVYERAQGEFCSGARVHFSDYRIGSNCMEMSANIWDCDESDRYILYAEEPEKAYPFPLEDRMLGIYPEIIKIRDSFVYLMTGNWTSRKIVRVPLGEKTLDHAETVIDDLYHSDGDGRIYAFEDRIALVTVKNLKNVVQVYADSGELLYEYEPEGVASIVARSGKIKQNILQFEEYDYLCNFTEWELDLQTLEARNISRSPAPEWTDAIEIKRVFVTSKDKTKIPVTLIQPKKMNRNADNPTILYGYGGFGVCHKPGLEKFPLWWAAKRGVYAIAHIRGDSGWEKGWMEAGSRLNKQNGFDDFVACAEYLIEQKYTRSAKMVSFGGSNCGLLVAVTMQQRPDLFAGVVCGIPVLDMLYPMSKTRDPWPKLSKTTYIDMYGTPEIPEDFKALISYSPLHNIEKNKKYPPVLVMTMGGDERVHPGHSMKFVASMQEKSHPDNTVLLWYREKGMHHNFLNNDEGPDIETYADIVSFIDTVIENGTGFRREGLDEVADVIAFHQPQNPAPDETTNRIPGSG